MAIGGSSTTSPRLQVPAKSSGLSGFKLNQDIPKHRLIANIEGLQKCGKNHLSFTAPGDLAVQSFDIGLEGVVEKFNRDKRIHTAEYELEHQPGKDYDKAVEAEAIRLWNKFVADYLDALATSAIRTVIWDTGTEVWELLRLKSFGKLSANSQHYGEVNAEFRRLIRAAYDTDKNFILIHQMKDEWALAPGQQKQSRTGRLERAGFKEIPYLVQANIRCWREEVESTSVFHATMADCRQNPDCNNMDFTGDMFHFAQIAQIVFPESDFEHWG